MDNFWFNVMEKKKIISQSLIEPHYQTIERPLRVLRECLSLRTFFFMKLEIEDVRKEKSMCHDPDKNQDRYVVHYEILGSKD